MPTRVRRTQAERETLKREPIMWRARHRRNVVPICAQHQATTKWKDFERDANISGSVSEATKYSGEVFCHAQPSATADAPPVQGREVSLLAARVNSPGILHTKADESPRLPPPPQVTKKFLGAELHGKKLPEVANCFIFSRMPPSEPLAQIRNDSLFFSTEI